MEETLYCEGAEALAQVAQKSCGCPIHGSSGRYPCLQKMLFSKMLFKVPSNPNHSVIPLFQIGGGKTSLRQPSAVVVSGPLQWKVFHTDILRLPQVTPVLQMPEDRSVTAISATAHGGYFSFCFFRTSVLSHHWSWWKTLPSWGWENWAKKGKHHRELLSRTIKTKEISVPPPSRD